MNNMPDDELHYTTSILLTSVAIIQPLSVVMIKDYGGKILRSIMKIIGLQKHQINQFFNGLFLIKDRLHKTKEKTSISSPITAVIRSLTWLKRLNFMNYKSLGNFWPTSQYD